MVYELFFTALKVNDYFESLSLLLELDFLIGLHGFESINQAPVNI
jgi:hypothetical protein